jgi:probable addiction module antidote protein
MIELRRYQREDGNVPVSDWLQGLRDARARAQIEIRLRRLSMSKRKPAASVSHTEETIRALRADRELAIEYLKAALAELDDPDNRAAGLLALRDIAEACGGLGAIAADAGIRRESLHRALSPKGNPTLKTLLAVLKAVGMRLSVEPVQARA